MADRAKSHIVDLARRLEQMGYQLLATTGTAARLEEAGVQVRRLKKIQEGHPNLLDYMINGDLQLVMNTPSGKGARTDEGKIRATTVMHNVPLIATVTAARSVVQAIQALRAGDWSVKPLQDYFATSKTAHE